MSTPYSPLIDISVVVAAKNEEVYLKTALESILAQRSINFELVFIDDCSTDATLQIARELEKENLRLRVFQNPKSGKCSAFNFGVTQAKGRFICIFAGDDLMPQGSLAARFSAVKEYPDEIPAVGLSKLTTMSDIKKFDGHIIPRAPGRGALSGVSPLMNQTAAHKIFPVPEILPNEDTWMELAVLHMPNWTIIHSNIICCQWRVHTGNSINLMSSFVEFNRKITIRMRANKLFFERYGQDLDKNSRAKLEGKIICEDHRSKGSIIGILKSDVGFVEKLRALASANAFLYGIRQRFYGIFSGWQ
ncbi:glycosyltransferase family 2 protein [Hydrogenophaga palleronii]|uniref:glycosyltransferase family 2 protein n=1 Tax=Hydrogenophaga palleronii TaxID=65655 RepID=UPI0008242FE1|nr:glycosyltransferase family A protein [Hydrogenophaga palleronii]